MKKPLNPPDVEALLKAAAAWEPDALPPPDFADFARQALNKRKPARAKTVWFAPPRRLGLVCACGVGACFLWTSGMVHIPRPETRKARINPPASTVLCVTPLAVPTPHLAYAQPVQAQRKRALAAKPVAFADAAPPVRVALRRIKRAPVFAAAKPTPPKPTKTPAVSVSATLPEKTNTPLWTTETVERPAWGAMVPMTVACRVEGEADAPGDETVSAVVPVVWDVALPDEVGVVAENRTGE